MTGPKRMRPESAEADSELAISYVVEPERRMSDLSLESAGSAVATGRRSARGNWHSRPRIGIMGGTFDPIHNGHLVAASEVSWVYDLDEVIFVPTGRPVFKLDKNVTNAEDRYLMTVIATASNPKFTVSRVDIDRPGVTYTIDISTPEGKLKLDKISLAEAQQLALVECLMKYNCATLFNLQYTHLKKGKDILRVTVYGFPARYKRVNTEADTEVETVDEKHIDGDRKVTTQKTTTRQRTEARKPRPKRKR